MCEWKNYGDVSIEHGMIWVLPISEDVFRIVKNDIDADTESHYVRDLEVDISDNWIDVKGVSDYSDSTKLDNPVDFAIACTNYYSPEHFGETVTVRRLYEVLLEFEKCGIPVVLEDAPTKYNKSIMKYVRQHLDLEPEDTSKDDEINNMSPTEVFERVLSWDGIQGYTSTIKGWVEDIFKVNLDKEEE